LVLPGNLLTTIFAGTSDASPIPTFLNSPRGTTGLPT